MTLELGANFKTFLNYKMNTFWPSKCKSWVLNVHWILVPNHVSTTSFGAWSKIVKTCNSMFKNVHQNPPIFAIIFELPQCGGYLNLGVQKLEYQFNRQKQSTMQDWEGLEIFRFLEIKVLWNGTILSLIWSWQWDLEKCVWDNIMVRILS